MKKSPTKKLKLSRVIVYYLMGVLAGLLGMMAMVRIIWHSKFYPNVTIGSVAVGGLRRDEARALIEKAMAENEIKLSYNGFGWSLPASAIPVNIEESLNQAYRVGRRLDLRDYALVFVAKEQRFALVTKEGVSEAYTKLYEEMAQAIEIPTVPTELRVNKGKIEVMNGSDGVMVDSARLYQAISTKVAKLETGEVAIPTQIVSAQLREDETRALLDSAERLLPKTIRLTLDDDRIELAGSELLSFLEAKPGSPGGINQERLSEYVEAVAESLNREPVDAKFGYQEGRVTEFAPSRDGLKVDVETTMERVEEGIRQLIVNEEGVRSIEIAAERTPPVVTIDKVNELGIKERIGRGESYYAHSIPNRIYNVGLAAERINTVLVPPGEEASFNKMVGEVSAATGYRSAYIISQGRTILGDGGGLCQVSTTLFRAAMNAGLPILERWGHSYRVSYYEQNSKAGLDATVIAPSKDFRFRNDTPGHILIQTINDPKNLHLVIEIYGTSDGRVATLTEPKVWGITPPLPTIYQDDPSLPAGTTKQVDWAASGARASFEYKVTRNGETLQDQTFSTVYRPWAAVYLRGTGQ